MITRVRMRMPPMLPGMDGFMAREAERLAAFVRGGKRAYKATGRGAFRARHYLTGLRSWNDVAKYCNACHVRLLTAAWASHVVNCPTIALFVRLGGCSAHEDCKANWELGRACSLGGRA